MKIQTIIYDNAKEKIEVIKHGSPVKFLMAGKNQKWIKAEVEYYNEYSITFKNCDDEELEVKYHELVDIQLIDWSELEE